MVRRARGPISAPPVVLTPNLPCSIVLLSPPSTISLEPTASSGTPRRMPTHVGQEPQTFGTACSRSPVPSSRPRGPRSAVPHPQCLSGTFQA